RRARGSATTAPTGSGGGSAIARASASSEARRRAAGSPGPSGRCAPAAAGWLEYPWRRFVVFDAVAATSWALYAALLGYLGGKVFEEQPWKGLLAALGIAGAVTGGIELVRWWRRRAR